MDPRIHELRQLGWRRAAFRIGYELKTRSGLEAVIRPVRPGVQGHSSDHAAAARMAAGSTALVDHFMARASDPRTAPDGAESSGERSVAFGRGQAPMFSGWTAEFGTPLDWHLDPWSGRRWPATDHWTTAIRAGVGDIKLPWELGRFPIAFDWARSASAGDGGSGRAAFATVLADFERANPYRAGVHWASGQELAIRLVAWWTTFGALGGAAQFDDETTVRLLRQTRLHADHIEEQIDYARLAVYNNHLIGEALGLVLAAAVFPEAPGARKWRMRGLSLFVDDGLDQFNEDGGYIQSSHNYHRLALHYCVWLVLLGDLYGFEPGDRMFDVLGRSRDYLLAQQDPVSGMLPNWGANDGALLNRLTACEYADFRPLIRTITALLGKPSPYAVGPWDEEAAWLVARDYPLETEERVSAPGAFPVSGLYVTADAPRGPYAVLRAGTVRSRFGQADQHHVDVWWEGVNVVVDPGTYSYNARPAYHAEYNGTRGHSTVIVHDMDQMEPWRRFKWLHWTTTEVRAVEVGDAGTVRLVAATHDGYTRPGAPGVLHTRELAWTDADRLTVIDRLDRVRNDGQPYRVRLHWLLGDFLAPGGDADPTGIRLLLPSGTILSIAVETEGLDEVEIDLARAVEQSPRGWVSRTYGRLDPAVSFRVDGWGGPDTVVFRTVFRALPA